MFVSSRKSPTFSYAYQLFGYCLKKTVFALMLIAFANIANAATFTISTPAANGTFTLSWSGVRTYAELYELVNGVRQKIGNKYNPGGSLDQTKAPGTYTYILVDVFVYGSQGSSVPQENRIEIQQNVVVAAPSIPPSTPASISVNSNDFEETITVSWASATGALSYELERNGSNIYSGTSTQITPSGSSANTSYTFRVRACNSYGCSGWNTANAVSMQQTFDVPPTSSTGQYSISIVTPPSMTYTRVEERMGLGGSWTLLAVLSGSQSYAVTRTNGTYYYRLQYCYQNGPSPSCSYRAQEKSTVVTFPTPDVPVFKANPAPNNVGSYTVEWNGVSYAKKYELFENDLAVDNGGNPLFSSKSYNDKITSIYNYKVRACNDTGCSNFSSIQTVKVANSGTITSVNSIMNSASGVAGITLVTVGVATRYEIQPRVNSGVWGATQNFTAKAFNMPAVTVPGTYSYQARACATVSDYTACSAWVLSNNVSASTPAQPVLSLASTNAVGSVSMSWTNPVDANSFVLNENGTDVATGITTTSYGPVAKPNGSYSYKVKACNAVGCGNYSSSATINVAKIGAMGAVAASLNQSTGVATVSWGAVSGNSQYEIQALLNGSAYGSVVTTPSTSTAMPAITTMGTYSYKTRACAIAGNYTNCSSWSTSNSVVPTVPNTAPLVTVPLNSISGVFSIKWSAISDAERYEIYENGNKIASTSAANFDFTSSNARPSGQYTYTVRACKALCGPVSNQAQITVMRSNTSNSSSSGSVLTQPVVDPLNDVMVEDKFLGGAERYSHSRQ